MELMFISKKNILFTTGILILILHSKHIHSSMKLLIAPFKLPIFPTVLYLFCVLEAGD